MSNVLYLVHRLPYPPNKGDKVRSYHLLEHLAKRHRVFLGTFVDDPQDTVHLPTVRSFCADMHAVQLHPKLAKVRSLSGMLRNEPLTLAYYRSRSLQQWVARTLREQQVDAAVAFSSPMAMFVEDQRAVPRRVVDFVDVDSFKWTQYADKHRWLMSWLYRREGRSLLRYERLMASQVDRSFFVTQAEVDLFCSLAPECASKVEAMGNGVNVDYFSPQNDFPSPFREHELPVVFTGAMDYWPNVDAVTWFVADILPDLVKQWPQLCFYIVGRSPTAAVSALAGPHVVVTGTVADVRPYLQRAAAVVAPLRVARGVQNKILEAMAMGLPVVASRDCAGGIDAVQERDFLTAGSASEFVAQVGALLRNRQRAAEVGAAARQRVLAAYSWDAHLGRIDRYLDS